MNPYLAGLCLGLTLLASFAILGVGLGASAGLARLGAFLTLCVARSHTLASEYYGNWGEHPLRYYLVYMFLGVFVGGLFHHQVGVGVTGYLRQMSYHQDLVAPGNLIEISSHHLADLAADSAVHLIEKHG